MNKVTAGLDKLIHFIGNMLVQIFHTLALFAIGAAVVWGAGNTYWTMFKTQHFSIEDILLLFIYLELAAMVGIYFKTSKMPVRFLIYIAITAITRVMIGMLSHTHKADIDIVIASGAILILTIATLVLRYGTYNMPLDTGIKELTDFKPLPTPGQQPAAQQQTAAPQQPAVPPQTKGPQ